MIDVNTVYASIQGEGALSGTPMIVLRLMGCGVGCRFCDTKETWNKSDAHFVEGDPLDAFDAIRSDTRPHGPSHRSFAYARFDPNVIAGIIRSTWPAISWVLVTGGEPAEQPVVLLADALHDVFKKVAIETSGTALGHVDTSVSAEFVSTPFDWVCLSPKIDNPAGRTVYRECVRTADEIKFVIGKVDDVVVASRFLAQHEHDVRDDVQISVQPMSQSPSATKLCIDAAMMYDWRLSLQMHKYLGIP